MLATFCFFTPLLMSWRPAIVGALIQRLVASLCPVETSSSSKEGDAANALIDSAQPDDEDKHPRDSTESHDATLSSASLASVNLASWKSKGLTRVLRDIGLLEGSEGRSLSSAWPVPGTMKFRRRSVRCSFNSALAWRIQMRPRGNCARLWTSTDCGGARA